MSEYVLNLVTKKYINMKSFAKFFLGLSCGLAIGFVFFSMNTAQSENVAVPHTQITNSDQLDDPKRGRWVTTEEATQMENAFTTFMTSKGAVGSNAGFLGEKYIRDIIGCTGGDCIKYAFTYENIGGQNKFGLVITDASGTKHLATGVDGYCPNQCSFPTE